MGAQEDQPIPVVILTVGHSCTDDDKALISELERARVGQGPRRLPITQVTPADLKAWRDGRTEEAIRGIEHRWQHGKSEELAEAPP